MRLMPVLAADAAAAISRADLIARLDDAAQSDPLTALPNRRASEAQLDRHVAHAQRTGAAFSVAVLDIDGLKEVNDREGHEAGDELLRRAADAWRHAVRREDQLARVGGDEFVLLMPDTDEAEARHAAERVRATAPGVPVAVGVSQWRRGESPQQVLARADERMYAEKALHRKQ
jgi:diguanylate cyclase (GGDEF)-like protein